MVSILSVMLLPTGSLPVLHFNQKMDEQPLLSRVESTPAYDPFASPPSLALADTHRQSTMVGRYSGAADPQFCPCCDNIVNKTALGLCFRDDELLFLGVGYPLYYKLAKYFLAIMVGIFFVSGSAIYFMMALTCGTEGTCYTLFGFPIINISVAEQTNLNKTEIVHMATAIAIFFIVVFLKTVINEDVRVLTNKKLCPSLYTVMLQNLPPLDNEQLLQWVQERLGEKPVVVNWSYNVQELELAYKEKGKAVIELNKIRIRMRKQAEREAGNPNSILNDIKRDEKSTGELQDKCRQLQAKIASCDQILDSYNGKDKVCEKTGTVFVSFEHVSTANRILLQHECSFFNSIMKSLFSFIKRSQLELAGNIIIVSKAPAPREVIWDNLHFSYIRSLVFEALFIVSMLAMLGGALKVILVFMNEGLSYRIAGESSGSWVLVMEGVLISLLILLINCLMRLVIQAFAYAKKYYSYTKYEASFCLYYSLFYIINACCLVYMVHGTSKEATAQLLFADIHLIMIANAFSEPFYKLIDPVMWGRVVMRRYVSRLLPSDNPYTQQYVNDLWEGHQISNADNYQYITRVLFVTTWFASVAPVGVFLSIVGVFLDYWISRVLLARVYKVPESISEDIATPSLMGLELLPLVYICGVLQFSYKVSTSADIFAFFTEFFHYGITTVVILLCICGYLIFCKRAALPDTDRTYSSSRLGFGYNYETTNPITKLQGDINFLYEVVRGSGQNLESSRMATQLLNDSAKHPLAIKSRREELNRIKMALYKRLSEKEHHIELQEMHKHSQDP